MISPFGKHVARAEVRHVAMLLHGRGTHRPQQPRRAADMLLVKPEQCVDGPPLRSLSSKGSDEHACAIRPAAVLAPGAPETRHSLEGRSHRLVNPVLGKVNGPGVVPV